MKRISYHIILQIMLIFSTLLFNVSCDEEEIVDNIPDQLFRPVTLSAYVNEASVTFSWVPIANATYQLEVSKDSLLFQQDLQVFNIDEGEEILNVENLWSNSLYSARIKAVSVDEAVKDSEYKQITFTTGTENIFYGVTDEDVGTDYVLLKWKIGKEVSHIVVSGNGANDVTIPLNASDVLALQKRIEGLNSATQYTFKIYFGEMLRGTVSVTTN